MINVFVGTVVFTLLILLLSVLVLRTRSLLFPDKLVSVSINHGHTLEVKNGQKLLGVLNDADIAVPSACAGVGTCGLCRVQVTAGGGDLLPIESSRLTVAERQKGIRLACQVTVRDAIDVEIAEQILGASTRTCSVKSSRNLSPLIKEIVLDLPADESLELIPGSYVQITAPPYRCQFAKIDISDKYRDTWNRLGVAGISVDSEEPVTRAYSTANLPSDSGQIVLLIRLALPPPGKQQQLPPGIVSSWLFQLRQGDQVDVGGPYSEFFTRKTDQAMVFIGGGAGMAPLRSMIHHELSSGNARPISFYYGARSLEDLFYVDEFNWLAKRYDNFSWTAALSDPVAGDDWDGPVGFIHEVVQRQYMEQHARPDKSDYYLCGPPLMQRAVVNMLDDAGVDNSTIFADNFGA